MNNLKGQQLIEYLNYLSQMLLEYRDKLNFNKSIEPVLTLTADCKAFFLDFILIPLSL